MLLPAVAVGRLAATAASPLGVLLDLALVLALALLVALSYRRWARGRFRALRAEQRAQPPAEHGERVRRGPA